MNPMLVIAKETLNLLRDEYRQVKEAVDSSELGIATQAQLDRMKNLVDRGEAVKKSIAIMEKVLENKPNSQYKAVEGISGEEAERIFS